MINKLVIRLSALIILIITINLLLHYFQIGYYIGCSVLECSPASSDYCPYTIPYYEGNKVMENGTITN